MDIEIKIAQKSDFEQIYDLMDFSFPAVEHRTKEKQKELFENKLYKVMLFNIDGIFAGFMAYWNLTGFAFGEHFAVNPDMRNKGIGSKCLHALLNELNIPFVLEVEDIDEDMAKRRIVFYKRNGFILSDISYIQPPLQPTSDEVMLKLMYNPNGKETDLMFAKKEIFEKVYNITEKR